MLNTMKDANLVSTKYDFDYTLFIQPQLVQLLIMIVNDTSMKEPHELNGRQVAAVLFKNSLYMGTLENDTTNFSKSVWFTLDDTTKENIKVALLTTLGGSSQGEIDHRLMKDTSVCISAIAGLEIPMGQWTDFVKTMAEQGM